MIKNNYSSYYINNVTWWWLIGYNVTIRCRMAVGPLDGKTKRLLIKFHKWQFFFQRYTRPILCAHQFISYLICVLFSFWFHPINVGPHWKIRFVTPSWSLRTHNQNIIFTTLRPLRLLFMVSGMFIH